MQNRDGSPCLDFGVWLNAALESGKHIVHVELREIDDGELLQAEQRLKTLLVRAGDVIKQV